MAYQTVRNDLKTCCYPCEYGDTHRDWAGVGEASTFPWCLGS